MSTYHPQYGPTTGGPSKYKPALALLALLLMPVPALAGLRDAAQKVKQGVRHYNEQDYTAAAKAFAEADVAQPDDPQIAYDRACAMAAAGDVDKATELYQQAALSPDRTLATRCYYNLGCLAAAKARGLFGEKPEEAAPQVRQEGLGLLASAVGYYRDCLKLEENHTDARHNLEVIRLWIKHMQALWEERDRQKQREEMNLLEFLMMIEARQRELRASSRSMVAAPDSPQRRQALTTTESSQRSLAEEIEPLKEKIAGELQQPQQAPGTPSGPAATPAPADVEKAVNILTGLADETAQAMIAAADQLDAGPPGEAVKQQAAALEKLDQIYMVVVPFPNLVQRAIATQQGLIEQVAPIVEEPDQQDQIDFGEAAWNQRFVARWGQVLGPKAEQGLKHLETMDPAAMAAAVPGGPRGGAPDPEALKQQMEGLKQSMEKAVELAPKVQELADEAAADLEQEKPADALPKQEEALKLLKEIADPLPKQDQQQDQQQQDQQQSDQEQQQQQKQQQRDLSKQQAESVLRKARDRQRERREMEKQLQRYLYRPGQVEKDW